MLTLFYRILAEALVDMWHGVLPFFPIVSSLDSGFKERDTSVQEEKRVC